MPFSPIFKEMPIWCILICCLSVVSILHYTKGTRNFYAQHANPHQLGSVGSKVTPGSPQYGCFSGFPDSGSGKSGKTGKMSCDLSN